MVGGEGDRHLAALFGRTVVYFIRPRGVASMAMAALAARRKPRQIAQNTCRNIVLRVEVDGRPIGNGHPGSLTERLRAAFHDVAQKRQLA